MSIELRRADAADTPAILDLAASSLGWERSERFAELFAWKHDLSPFGSSPRWVALDGDRVVGFRVFMRWRFKRGLNASVEAVRAVDTATHPDWRGRGLFRDLTLTAVESEVGSGCGFVFNTPNDQSRPGYLKMGWIELGRPSVSVVFRPGSIFRIARAKAPANLWGEQSNVGETVDSLLGRGASTSPSTQAFFTDATPDYLAWRYSLQSLGYRSMSLSNDPAEGWLIFRLRRRASALEATICALETPDRRSSKTLLRRLMRQSQADYGLIAADTSLLPQPSLRLAAVSPIVTWRALNQVSAPTLSDFSFSLGDLELF